MALEKILVTVKTYPSLSQKYDELVCTAGFREDGSWVRIYPIPFRKLEYETRYAKYQWIKLHLVKNTSDPRPESYRPTNYDDIILGDMLDTDKGLWTRRKEVVLRKVYTNLSQLIEEAQNKSICTSLAVFKPKEITNFIIENADREWDSEELSALKEKAKQTDMFCKSSNPFEVIKKVPYKFSYSFIDEDNTKSTLKIEDWEIGQLYWNSVKRHNGNEINACTDVKRKYFDDFAKTKDLHLYLGTTRRWHFSGTNPFIIIGTFHPMIETQSTLF